MTEIFQSNFVFGLKGNLYQEFLNKAVRPVIQDIIGANDYELIDFDKHLSKLDFDKSKRKESIFPEFYLNFLGDIIKDNDIVAFKKKVCITLDERLCTDICPNTGRKITTIKIGGVELAYFIYFEIREFFDFVYNIDNDSDIFIKKTFEENRNKEEKRNSNELVELKKEGESVSDDNTIPQLLSKKLQTQNSQNLELVKNIGYIHNTNQEKGFSFVRDTVDGKSGFPVMHSDFPDIAGHPVGTVIKAYGYYHNDLFFINNYEVGEYEDLPFQILQLSGMLRCHDTKGYAIIRTNLDNVYVSSDLLLGYSKKKIYNVKCIAVQAYDKNRETMGWKAIYVENLDSL